MAGSITDEARSEVLRAALARVDRQEMRAALASAAEPTRGAPKAAVNALHALRKHRDPTEAVGRPAYRSALPWVATAIADECLARTIEELGEASEDPTREQLLSALDGVRAQYSDVTIGVMLATVAGADMPASDLCFAILSEDERFGLTTLFDPVGDPDGDASDAPERTATGVTTDTASSGQPTDATATETTATETTATETTATETAAAVTTDPAQREARRARKRQEAEARRKKLEASRRAAEQARRARKQGRSGPPRSPAESGGGPTTVAAPAAPRLTRRALLTPADAGGVRHR